MTVNNSLFVIAPYWDSGTWVFDDERVGLVDKELKTRSPRDISLGEPMPTDEGLPSPDSIRHAVTGATNGEEAPPEIEEEILAHWSGVNTG